MDKDFSKYLESNNINVDNINGNPEYDQLLNNFRNIQSAKQNLSIQGSLGLQSFGNEINSAYEESRDRNSARGLTGGLAFRNQQSVNSQAATNLLNLSQQHSTQETSLNNSENSFLKTVRTLDQNS